jgi:aspartate carbamoyltransferase catalytic subunit
MHLLSTSQFDKKSLLDFVSDCRHPSSMNSDDIRTYTQQITPIRGRTMASLFYEPSTRTRFSFEAAMHQLGGQVISESAPKSLSAAKGESLEDTIKTVAEYVDVIVLRHPDKGSAERAAAVSKVPVINAGDGAGEHPTQALLDFYTIFEQFSVAGKTVFNFNPELKVLFCGDLVHSRPVHSLISLLKLFPKIKILTASPKDISGHGATRFPGLALKDYENMTFEEGLSCEPDIVYMTRLQRERLGLTPDYAVPYDYLEQRYNWNNFTLTPVGLAKLKKNAIVMHPLPRNSEIHPDCDKDGRCVYFTKQIGNGLKVRKTILLKALSIKL